MALPKPQLGLVISYSYVWHHEARRGIEEGRKDRPCVIVLAVEHADDGVVVTVAPVTHAPPDDQARAFELPAAVKAHLGLDQQRSWVILDEGNRFAWPGFDLRPIPGQADRFDYGFLPPRLFNDLVDRFRQVWLSGMGKAVRRD